MIARDEDGPSGIVVDKESGYLVTLTDLGAFMEKVVLLDSDAQLRTRMSLKSRRLDEEGPTTVSLASLPKHRKLEGQYQKGCGILHFLYIAGCFSARRQGTFLVC